MIRAVMTKTNGEKILVLGVDEVNVQRLCSGQPIMVKGESLGLSIDVAILYGTTTTDIVDELRRAGFHLPDDPQVGEVYERSVEGSVEGYQRVEKKKG